MHIDVKARGAVAETLSYDSRSSRGETVRALVFVFGGDDTIREQVRDFRVGEGSVLD
jgi:hypothetical protein